MTNDEKRGLFLLTVIVAALAGFSISGWLTVHVHGWLRLVILMSAAVLVAITMAVLVDHLHRNDHEDWV